MKFRVLVVGSGAREHALAWKLSRSSVVSELLIWPGNALSAKNFSVLPLEVEATIEQVLGCSRECEIDAIVIGSEAYLEQGFSDLAEQKFNIPVFGPRQQGARLETSKAFSKEIMTKANIPTARFKSLSSRDDVFSEAQKMLKLTGGVVIKASGLAAGKGVFVCRSEEHIQEGLARLKSTMTQASQTIVLEEVLLGRECSFFCLLGDGDPKPLGFAVDFKRLLDQDEGPNTGGMGCYSPVAWLPENAEAMVMEKVVYPLLIQLRKEKIPYRGCLYVGLMWSEKNSPQVVEFNVRFGDPEAQVLARADSRDWGILIGEKLGLISGSNLSQPKPSWSPSVCVVMASAGYPFGENEQSGEAVQIADLSEDEHSVVFAASVKSDSTKDGAYSERIETGRGRVFSVVGTAGDLVAARQSAYNRVKQINHQFTNARYRTDIAANFGNSKNEDR